MGIGGEPVTTDLGAEVVEVFGVEAPFEKGAGIDAGNGVALDIDVIARIAVGLAPEEMVEPDLVESCRGGKSGKVAADAFLPVVGVDDHHRRVPTNEAANPSLQVLVAGIVALVFGGNGVDVGSGGGRRDPQVDLVGPLEQLG